MPPDKKTGVLSPLIRQRVRISGSCQVIYC